MSGLFEIDADMAWHSLPWQGFEPSSEVLPRMAIQPVCAFVNRGNDVPLNREYEVVWKQIEVACQSFFSGENQPSNLHSSFRILPSFNRVPNLVPEILFGTSLPAASKALFEIADSVQKANVRKIVFVHANPILGPWLDTVARELRIYSDMRVFTIQLEFGSSEAGVVAEERTLDALLREVIAFPANPPF
ncbi:MAG: hypothetical protein AAGJ81_08770 [Verrucomicrobiota bacterium]